VAAAAALVASVGTAGLVHGLDGASHGTPVSLASLEPQSSSVVPVAGSTNASPNWEAVAKAVRPSVVAITVTMANGQAEGSGVILDAQGHILTNNHVVSGANGDVEVTLSDGRVFKASVVGTDAATDLAVVKLTDPPKDLAPAVIGKSDEVTVGQPVMAVGNPLGLSSTVTTGIVSALDRPVSTSSGSSQVVTNAIQIDAAINPGNSGGPLFDASGKVIGITSSIATLSSGGGESGSIGLGFAIPSALADRVAAELLADGTASHAYLGVGLKDGTATADGVTRRGAVVEQVNDGTPAQKAGLRTGDVVVAIGGASTPGAESLTGYVRELASGQTATLTVVRDGKTFDVDVTFAALPAATDSGNRSNGNGNGNGNGGSDPNGSDPNGSDPNGNGRQGGGSDGSQGSGPQDGLPGLPGLPWGQQG
jgi:putative serine protease PepD